MTNKPSTSLQMQGRATRLAAACTVLTLVFSGVASGETPAAAKPETTTVTPYSLPQDAVLTSSTNAVSAARVPAIDAKGVVHYWDVNLLFDTSTTGELTLASGYPEIVASASPIDSTFKAGTYVGPSNICNGNAVITVNGPSVMSGGATVWTLQAASGASSCTYPASATWYVEPSLSNNPLYPRIKAAGITNTQVSYGDGPWECTNDLLSFSQSGNSLSISTYSDCGDRNFPDATITYELKQ